MVLEKASTGGTESLLSLEALGNEPHQLLTYQLGQEESKETVINMIRVSQKEIMTKST